jgi:hypothetical protein
LGQLLRNWISMAGAVVVAGSVFSTILLFLMDVFSKGSDPYLGILTYIVAPGFFFLGLGLTIGGAIWERKKLKAAAGGQVPGLVIDFSRPRDRRILGFFVVGAVVFLLASAVGSYQTYHFTESVTFCGEACHTVMKPELVLHQLGSHARISCTECHIGSGAEWFVKAKISGTYQLYAVAFNKYPRPVPTPIKNLRPARDTCEQCHWPQKFVGNLERTINYYLPDETNTPFSIRLLMKVGGGDPTHGRVGGIHWHMNVGKKVEYLATDEDRQKIPWVRTVDELGVVTEFRTRNFTNDISGYNIRTMDCMDCHNRPAHTYRAPNDAVDLAITLGQIDRHLKWIKTNAVFALTRSYTNEAQALGSIDQHLRQQYPQEPAIGRAIEAVKKIYSDNFFPEMKANWKAYPNNIGHMEWRGCFRCHDGQHKTADGRETIKASDCNTCHTILAQGSGAALQRFSVEGMKFEHPGGDLDEYPTCDECHTGGL